MSHCCKRYIVTNAENMNCTFIRSASNELRNWVEGKTDNICLISASPEFLNLLAGLGKEDSYYLTLNYDHRMFTESDAVARSVPSLFKASAVIVVR